MDNSFIDRLKQEIEDLQVKQNKLEKFINSSLFSTISEDEKYLLQKQFNLQHVLLQTLNQRFWIIDNEVKRLEIN